MRERVLAVIFEAVEEVNRQLPPARRLEKDAGAVLFGPSGTLTSLEFVSLIAEVEMAVEEALGVEITLADERALSQRNSPFRSIGTLADYVERLLAEAADA